MEGLGRATPVVQADDRGGWGLRDVGRGGDDRVHPRNGRRSKGEEFGSCGRHEGRPLKDTQAGIRRAQPTVDMHKHGLET